MANRLDYQSAGNRPDPLQTFARLLMFALLLTAMLHLLMLHTEVGAPFRQGGHPPPSEMMIENMLTEQDTAMAEAAGDKNLELHFAVPIETRTAQKNRLAATYFNWNYLRYPRRVIVGKGDKIINNADQMFAADAVPDDAWLRDHDVKSVMTLIPGPGNSLESSARPLP